MSRTHNTALNARGGLVSSNQETRGTLGSQISGQPPDFARLGNDFAAAKAAPPVDVQAMNGVDSFRMKNAKVRPCVRKALVKVTEAPERSDFSAGFEDVYNDGHRCGLLAGASELAEVGILCALQFEVELAAMVDSFASATTMAGVPVVADYDRISEPFDVVITDMRDTGAVFASAGKRFGAARVRMPGLLNRVLGPEVVRAER